MSTSPNSPRFCVWVRRRLQSEGLAIRFEVAEGKGILRVARPGVLIDPPARPTGVEERLTSAQLRASRFLHVWEGGRQGHSLTQLEESALDRLPVDQWVALTPSADSTLHYLLLPDIAPEVDEEVGDEPTSPNRMLANLRQDLSAVAGDDELIEAGSGTDEVPFDTLPDDEEDERPASPPRKTTASREVAFPPPAIPVGRATGTVPPVPPVRPPAPRAEADVLQPAIRLGPSPEDDNSPATPLVRHLRRQVGRQGARILELEEEVRRLRAVITGG